MCCNDGTAHWSAKSKILLISYFRKNQFLLEFVHYCRSISVPVHGDRILTDPQQHWEVVSVSTQVQAETRG